jgi:hypothetical protein
VQLSILGILFMQVGLSDHLSVGGGAVLWGTFNGGPRATYANIKYSIKVGKKWHAGAELHRVGTTIQLNSLTTTPNKIVFIGKALATYTGFRFNATGSVGYGLIRKQDRLFSTKDQIVEVNHYGARSLVYSLNCSVRLTPRTSFVAESNIYPWYISTNIRDPRSKVQMHNSLLQSFGFNISGENLSYGLGIAYEMNTNSPYLDGVPYIDLAYKFGNNK